MALKSEKQSTKSNPAAESKTDPVEKKKTAAKKKNATAAKTQSTGAKKTAKAQPAARKKDTTDDVKSVAKTTKPASPKVSKKNSTKPAKGLSSPQAALTDFEKMALIEKTAYFIAEARGFTEGDPMQDWLLAETKVNEMLQQSGM